MKKFGDNFWVGAKYGAISGAAAGAASGAISGYISAKEQGWDPWTGGPTKTQKAEFLEAQKDYMSKYEYGEYNSTKIKGGPYAETNPVGKPSDQRTINDRTCEQYASETQFSRRAVKDWVRNPSETNRTVFPHERGHAYDYASGMDDYMLQKYPELYYDVKLMEYRTYSLQFKYYTTGFDQLQQFNGIAEPSDMLMYPWQP